MASQDDGTRRRRSIILYHGFMRSIVYHDDIPNDIISLLVTFYHLDEYFDLVAYAYKLDERSLKITKTDWSTASVFGNITVDSTKTELHRWIFRIEQKGAICIGITDSSEHNVQRHCFGVSDTNNYFNVFKKPNSKSTGNEKDEIEPLIVRMELNLRSRQLAFYRGEHDMKTMGVRNVKCGKGICYKLAVVSRWSGSSVQLLRYNVIGANDYDNSDSE